MKRALGVVFPAVVAVVALVLVVLQQQRLSDLEAGLAAVETPAAASPPPVTPVVAVQKTDDRRVAALEARVVALTRRLDTLGERGSERQGRRRVEVEAEPRVGTDSDEVVSLREDVDALLTGEGIDTPEGRQKVSALVEKAQEEAREKRWERRRAARDEAQQTWLEEFSAKSGLDEATSAALGEVLRAQSEKRREVFRAVRDGDGSMEDARRDAVAMREATEAKVKELLTEEQFQAYEASREERSRGMRALFSP